MKALKRVELAIGGTVAVCLIAFVSVYISSNAREAHSLVSERNHNEASRTLLSIKSLLLRARELEKEFMLTRQTEQLEDLSQNLSDAIKLAIDLKSDEIAPQFKDLHRAILSYELATADTIELLSVIGLNHNSGLEGALRSQAHFLEREFARLDATRSMVHLMYMRRHEKDFMMRLEDKYIDRFQTRADLLFAEIKNIDLSANDLTPIRDALGGYQDNFQRWITNRRKLLRAKADLDQTFDIATDQADALIASNLGGAQTLETKAKRARSSSHLALFFAGIFGLVFGFLLLRMIFRQRRMAEEINALARKDTLTGLANRRGFIEELSHAMEKAHQSETHLMVGLVDLDGFKAVNDMYGHPAGDELLQKSAQRLLKVLPNDAFLARLGGDEFGLFISTWHNGQAALDLGRKVCTELRRPFELADGVARIGGSTGLTISRASDTIIGNLLARADYALYQSKQTSKGEPLMFTDDHEKEISRIHQMERLLLEAIEDDKIDVVFQPIVNPVDGTTKGMETLARLHCPILGAISPAEFIPLAEQIGAIGAVTDIVLRKALTAAKSWPDDIFLSVNLSALDIASEEASARILDQILKSSFPKTRLVFEITETAMLKNVDRSKMFLNQLRGLGVQVALDDFGTGYSSLSYLQHMPIDRLKIDRALLSDIETNDMAQRIFEAIMSLCNSIDVSCVIEGVERETQRDMILSYTNTLCQGYLFSKPMTLTATQNYFAKRHNMLSRIAS